MSRVVADEEDIVAIGRVSDDELVALVRPLYGNEAADLLGLELKNCDDHGLGEKRRQIRGGIPAAPGAARPVHEGPAAEVLASLRSASADWLRLILSPAGMAVAVVQPAGGETRDALGRPLQVGDRR